MTGTESRISMRPKRSWPAVRSAWLPPLYRLRRWRAGRRRTPAGEVEELNRLFSPADYEAEIAAAMKEYVSPDKKSFARWGSGADKPKYSASPMEHMKKETGSQPSAQYLCPRCREGHLRQIHGKNGVFWGCSNYPRCTATFDDSRGAPLLST